MDPVEELDKELDSTAEIASYETSRLLDEIDQERVKFLERNPELIALVREAVSRKVYPPTRKDGEMTALEMVEAYGSRWHRWRGDNDCPHCKADLRDYQNGPPYGLKIGMYHNDRTTHWLCPECNKTWKRR